MTPEEALFENLSCDLNQRVENCRSELCIDLKTCTESPTSEPTTSPTIGDCDQHRDDCEKYTACLEERIDELETDVNQCTTSCQQESAYCDSVKKSIDDTL